MIEIISSKEAHVGPSCHNSRKVQSGGASSSFHSAKQFHSRHGRDSV